MPRKKTNVTQLERTAALMKVLSAGGTMDKSTIDTRVAAALSVSPEEVAKNLYRDLQLLVDNGELEVFSPGDSIDETSIAIGDEVANKKHYWCLAGKGGRVAGDSLANQIGLSVRCSPRLVRDISFTWEQKRVMPGKLGLLLSSPKGSTMLTVNASALPISVFVLRWTDNLEESEVEISKITKRYVALFSDLPDLSAYKPGQRLGHARLNLSPEGLKTEDLQSTNGTKVFTYKDSAVIQNIRLHIQSDTMDQTLYRQTKESALIRNDREKAALLGKRLLIQLVGSET